MTFVSSEIIQEQEAAEKWGKSLPTFVIRDLPKPHRWDEHLAHWISDIFNPPLIAVIAILLVTQGSNAAINRWWLLYFLTLTVVIPLGYLLWKLRRGEISDFHIYFREQRIRPMTLTLACAFTALVSAWLGGAPRSLIIFAVIGTLQVALLLLVTLRWKISGHGAAIGSFATLLYSLYGSTALPAFLAIPVVAWARVRIQRHTLAQAVAGALVGVSLTMLLLLWMPLR